ncbi:serine/threonine-protein kinase [Sinomonas sp. JGH33]|uniref:non-specific serine/threonine protein kinase n=1 Tax=Sinomonas terricola TaxID=3110330 RepID=A0ABU5TA44_9MICC|nr:serine/threonine-protein kinase [Sinomonas sp. JGH33]MEA5456395.1 serine/threonine-protein kinase [Sinomonas sp. JGH33]
MNSRRPPSAPPALPGFDYVRVLGSGGFADVFLYQQQLPRRQVAVKVMLSDKLGADTISQFTDEANAMAQLATHPSIVSVYQAGISGDGRPYLVMEYCSKPNLQTRYRRERLSEAEALRVGVQIAGAVETAHRAGILHRDIKPANVLVTEYGRPALTDFGIAATAGGAVEASGMSVPWSPPESFASPARSEAPSDVYALGATLYTVLAGRSPFEIPGASNSYIDLIGRINTVPVPAIGRADVSSAFEDVLRKAMAKSPGDRFPSAMAFARELQRTQIGLGIQPTPIDVTEDEFLFDEDPDGDDGTRIRNIVTIDAQAPSAPAPNEPHPRNSRSRAAVADAEPLAASDDVAHWGTTIQPARSPSQASPSSSSRFAAPEAPPVADTVLRPVAAEQPVEEVPAGRRRKGVLIAAGAATVVVAGIALSFGLSATGLLNSPKQNTPRPSTAAPVDIQAAATVPSIAAVTGKVDGSNIVFTWSDPDPKDGDGFLWHTVDQGSSGPLTASDKPSATVPAAASGKTCIEVFLRRSSGRTSDNPTLGCAP